MRARECAFRAEEIAHSCMVRRRSGPPIRENPGVEWTRTRRAVLAGAYLAALATMIAVKGLFISADRYALILLVPALALGVWREYLRDFLPFIVAILLFEEVRGVAHLLNPDPYVTQLIDLDRFLGGGTIPTARLQAWLYDPAAGLSWYDTAMAVLQRMHFFIPPTLLFVIWLDRRELYYRCATTMVLVSFAAAFTFWAIPAAPPWYAAKHGFLDPLGQIGSVQASSSPVSTEKSWIAAHLLRNSVAAVPSLHAAYSLLTAIFAWRWRRRVGYAFLLYPVAMWFTIVYFADHYVVDVLAGIAFALAGWKLTGRAFTEGGRLRRLRGPFPPPIEGARFAPTEP